MKAELYWQETMYGDDFECCITAPAWMRDENDTEYGCDIWLKAYDTSMKESATEKELDRLGYKYRCEARLRHEGQLDSFKLATRAVRTREEAERFFREYVEQLEDDNNKAMS